MGHPPRCFPLFTLFSRDSSHHSLFISWSLLFISLPPRTVLSLSPSLFLGVVFVFSLPAVFLDRNLTHAFPFRILVGLFGALLLWASVPFLSSASCPWVKNSHSPLRQDDSAISFPSASLSHICVAFVLCQRGIWNGRLAAPGRLI